VEGSSAAYEQLIQLITEDFPDVAEQVRAEIRQGRPMFASHMAAEDRKQRQQLLSEEDLGRIRKTDVAVQPYDPDGRLLALLEALNTLVASMSGTRQALGRFGRQHGLQPPYVAFIDPDDVEPITFTGTIDNETVMEQLAGAAAIIRRSIDAVREPS
jgi:beta-phosphoglucomutase-like phosphatase (HAD superfamily)